MNKSEAAFLPTRESLLERLKQWDDQESWRDFFNMYWRMIYATALKSGLNDSEAQDVVQDTIIVVAKKMNAFRYDAAVDSFKGWLLYLTRKRIAMEYRKRARGGLRTASEEAEGDVLVDEIPDPASGNLDKIWEAEWAQTIWGAALSKVKQQVGAKHFQMFDLYVVKEQPAQEVAQALGVPVATVYLAKHRISALLKKELEHLKEKLG